MSEVLAGVVPVTAILALVLLAVYVPARRARTRSQRGHAQASLTGSGTWEAMIDEADLDGFFPDVRIKFVTSLFLSEGVPVRLEADPRGLRLRITARLLRKHADASWSAPWTDVVAAQSAPAGFHTLGGKLSTVRLTDVSVLITGASAQSVLDSWGLLTDEDEPPPTAEELAEDAEHLAFMRENLGPFWEPGTGLLRLRLSAPDELVETVDRWGRGTLPQQVD